MFRIFGPPGIAFSAKWSGLWISCGSYGEIRGNYDVAVADSTHRSPCRLHFEHSKDTQISVTRKKGPLGPNSISGKR